ncbi:MAG TPA: substrate-binding domain-containing protein [Gemmataceae bacterium]|jgi:molybdenum ABC transporter molybdate-binding protein|nr:substrate-binding domain-containing protein [Gemmataceae bacterium]
MSMRYVPWLAFVGSIAVLGGLIALWWNPKHDGPTPDGGVAERAPVVVHVAAAMRLPLEKAAADFEHDTGIKIELRFGPSETLLSNLKVSGQGDLFLPADESYVAAARKAGLVEQDYAIASMTAVAVIRADFPKAAKEIGWDDLFREGFRLVQPNPDITAIGKLTREGLTASGTWERIERAKPAMLGSVTEAANAVKLGSGDGAIIWDAVAHADPTLKVVHLSGLEKVTANVSAAVCNGAASRTEARWFAEYLAGESGQKYFRDLGYGPPREAPKPKARGAKPSENAELVLYAGAMLRPAIESTIVEFEQREHVKVTRVYNGCGILVGQMRTGREPDLYFACDPRFMGDVAELFLKPEVVSNNQLVIAVPKGNPAGIKELKNLGAEGLRVGVGHEQQCALGAITRETFLKAGVYAAVRNNVKMESPTGDLLVNQLRTGALDAVVCYISNVTPNLDKLDAIPVTGIACSAPEQPVAIAKSSANAELAAKLIEYLRSAESRKRFEELGFGWGRRGPKK